MADPMIMEHSLLVLMESWARRVEANSHAMYNCTPVEILRRQKELIALGKEIQEAAETVKVLNDV